MLFSSILILIVAKALPLIKISSIHFTRISAIILLLSGILSFNILYIQSIGSGIGIYSGLFNLTTISQILETFLLTIGSIILIFSFYKTLNKKIFIQLLLIFCIANIIYITNQYDITTSTNFYQEITLFSSIPTKSATGNTKNEKSGELIDSNQKELLFLKLIIIISF